MSVWDMRKEILYINGPVYARSFETTPFQSVRSMALSAMTVECE